MYSHDKNKPLAAYLKLKAAEHLDEELETDSLPVVDHQEHMYVQVFDVEHMEAIAGEHSRNSNLHRNHKRLINLLDGTDGILPLAQLPSTIIDDLDLLSNRFPNFLQAIEFYKQEFALGQLAEFPVFTAQPVLLIGPPGVGKTFFCHQLASIVKTHFELLSMSSMTAGFVIGGSSSSWGEGKPGKVAKAFAVGRHANPLFVVDEIDKAGGDQRYDSVGALYSLLERETAEKFIDEALEIPINASNAVWVATANDLRRIPEPILSRFTVVEVYAPTNTQMSLVLNSVYAKVLESNSWGKTFHEHLNQCVIDKLVSNEIEPRLLQKILISACGRAVLRTSANSESLQTKLEITVDDLNIHQNIGKSKLPADYKNNIKDDNKSEVVIMPIFNVPALSGEEYSEETIVLWAVYEISDSSGNYHHLAGYIPKRKTGRVTSPIQEFDKSTMRLTTSSGRVYKLDGPPSLKGETRLVWEEWKEKYDIPNDKDVTHQYYVIH